MNKSTIAKSEMSGTSKNYPSLFSKIFKKKENKYNATKVYVENTQQFIQRIQKTPSEHGLKKYVREFNAHPTTVRFTYDEYMAVRRHDNGMLNHPRIFEGSYIYTSDMYEHMDYYLKHGTYTLYYKEKPITQRCIPLLEYNIPYRAIVEVKMVRLLGGSRFLSNDHLRSIICFTQCRSDREWIIDLSESVALLLQDLYAAYQSKNKKFNVFFSLLRFTKSRSKKSLYSSYMNVEIMKMLDSMDFFFNQSMQDKLDDFKDLLENFDEVRNSKAMDAMKHIVNYAVAFSFFEKLGIPLKYTGFSMFEQEMLKKRVKKAGKIDFIHSMLTNLHYLTEKGYQYYVTGNKSAIFHSSKEYTKLYDKICETRTRSQILANCEVHGFTESQYRSDLDDIIEKLQSVIKFNDSLSKIERNKVRENFNEMSMLRFNLNTKRASREHRAAPFSILLYGDSGIGKSTLKDILFYHYASIFRLPKDKSFCYTRNPVAKYWDGFVSACWCIILDDIAFQHPNLGEDASCMEFLQIINSIPFVPDQASLEMKGMAALMAKLVIGTTNSKNLNAHFYFACASAAQRRFPWVVTPTVKKEFRDANGMLNVDESTQVEGEYPDYWTFKIEKVKSLAAIPTNMGKPATFEEVATFDNINTFLKWYSDTAVAYNENQKRVTSSIEMISRIELCETCHLAKAACLCKKDQALYIVSKSLELGFQAFLILLWQSFLVFFASRFENRLIDWLSKYSISFCDKLVSSIYARAATRYQQKIGKVSQLARISMLVSSALIGYKLTTFLIGKICSQESFKKTSQGQVGTKPEPMEFERENVWYNSNLEISSFNLTPQITSSKSLTRDQIIEKVGKNCHMMCVDNPILQKRARFRVVNLKGNLFLMNNHSWLAFSTNDIVTLISNPGYGINCPRKIKISECHVKRDLKNDLCVLKIPQVNPGPDITGLLALDGSIVKQNGFYIQRMEDANLEVRDVLNSRSIRYEGDGFINQAYALHISNPTVDGECGMPLILNTPLGFVWAGIHVSGSQNIAVSTKIDKSILDPLMEFVFQEGEPMLSAPSQKMELGAIHRKSVFNYLEEGNAKIYGTFTGFRRRPKSTVENTPIHDFLGGYGYQRKFTKPQMSGYKPFRIAAKDMVEPITNYDAEILEKCKKSFLKDILNKLDIEDIKNLVHPYDKHTAINGAPGVAYVDRIKVSTSAGNPWKCKKQKFLQPLDDGTDDYDMTKEIDERVNAIRDKYKKGIRAHPVFCAHLKDEAVSFKKASEGKTRVFTGAPMDWSIANRMSYLSLIRLIQNNKLAFETGVGTVAQSQEWSKLLQYLLREDGKPVREYTDHELLEKFIAGDYKAFDKKMPPEFILAAFWILMEISKLSGNYTAEEIKIQLGIAIDTAYPTVDFNGDLLQFLGSNPSGHPLTVIINSLVNSLYMRYAYYVLNPKKEVESFQDFVRLLTYGDDNTLTSLLKWFNHTTISKVLADIGVVYTMADKEAESVPFIHLRDVSFLKRTWKWNHELKTYLAPLEHDSIEKMLMTWTRSKISEDNQMIDVIKSAISEYFFYGKKVYKEKSELMRKVIDHHKYNHLLSPSVLPSWNKMKERFRKCSLRAGILCDDYEYDIEDNIDYDFCDELDFINFPMQSTPSTYITYTEGDEVYFDSQLPPDYVQLLLHIQHFERNPGWMLDEPECECDIANEEHYRSMEVPRENVQGFDDNISHILILALCVFTMFLIFIIQYNFQVFDIVDANTMMDILFPICHCNLVNLGCNHTVNYYVPLYLFDYRYWLYIVSVVIFLYFYTFSQVLYNFILCDYGKGLLFLVVFLVFMLTMGGNTSAFFMFYVLFTLFRKLH